MLDIRECREVPAELKRGGRSFWREQKELAARVTAVIDRVAQEGDAALTALSRELDGVELTAAELRVAPAELAEAAAALPAALKEALLVARENIRRFSAAPPPGSLTVNAAGAVLGTRSLPLKRVGVYIPGGRAAYPSSVLMNVVPAQAAGVAEIALATPPAGGHGHPLVLGTAYLLGVREVYCVGGAQAIAALALGTETIPAVDKVVGPGNAYVAAAKRLLFGCVGIDAVAGPSEVLILADAGAAPAVVARDLIAQAEHDAAAQALLVTTSQRLAEEVAGELEKELATLPRAELARAALASSAAYVVPDLELAVALANAWAPEHLELLLADPWAVLPRVQNAGTVFLGPYTPEALGDYIAGPSHVLPTGGTARFASPLGVEDFCKRLNFLAYGREAWRKDAPAAELLARAEGLAGHARALVGRE
ncbi:histidinol dehydrogenase [Gelria sp. Kuro-4]|uniref:histidinol dehydrogenase n=1 Tax=Gelria sp. Kuro-4 TaxID=2796927 RepID=UPI001BF012FA|nr:histidinol dehydrogenase [Gelria sp. Kuro-4]BCV25433.1 histidinol dehydrogenase [Gelria sp. Kuro-4]